MPLSQFLKVSVREKILLHLLEAAGAPSLASTQIGIAGATGLHRGHVSRALRTLSAEGLVVAERHRLAGFARALLVCRLTAPGQQAAHAVRAELEGLVVDVGRAGAHQRLGDALRAHGLPIGDALRQLEEAGALRGAAPPPVQPSPDYVWDLEDAPVVHGFVGRQEELARLAGWLRTPDPSCIVEGPGGIGKTSLVAHALHQTRPPRHVLWIRLSPRMNVELVLARLDAFLARLGRSVAAGGGQTPDAVLERLPERVRSLPLLLVLDDLHRADETLRLACERFAAAAARRGGLKVVWIGRTLRLPVEAQRRALRIDLAPLSDAECGQLLRLLEVPAVRREAVARGSGGNPLFLELLAAGRDPQSAREDFVRHLLGHLSGLASPAQTRLLMHLAALRVPVGPPALERLGEPTDLEPLVRAHVVERRADGALELHDAVRDAIYAQLGGEQRRRIHGTWARAFEPRDGLEDALEYLHHLTMAGRRPEAAWWTLRNQTRLLEWARGKFRHWRAPEAAAAAAEDAPRSGA